MSKFRAILAFPFGIVASVFLTIALIIEFGPRKWIEGMKYLDTLLKQFEKVKAE